MGRGKGAAATVVGRCDQDRAGAGQGRCRQRGLRSGSQGAPFIAACWLYLDHLTL